MEPARDVAVQSDPLRELGETLRKASQALRATSRALCASSKETQARSAAIRARCLVTLRDDSMDRAPEKLLSTSSRLIAMAASLVGSGHEVMAAMKCAEAAFLEYCAGRKEPSGPEFERLIELIIREQGTIIGQHRDLLEKARAKPRYES